MLVEHRARSLQRPGDASQLKRQRAGQQAGRFGDRSVGPGTRGEHRLGAFFVPGRMRSGDSRKGSVETSIVAGERYRWIVLAVGTAAQAAVSASWFAIAILAPDIRSEFGLSLTEIGVVLAAFTIGMTPTLLPWGLLADRIGERVVLPVGLGLSACALACVGIAPGYAALVTPACGGGRAQRQRQRSEWPSSDALVRTRRAGAGARNPPGERPDRRSPRSAAPARPRVRRRARLDVCDTRRGLLRGSGRRRRLPQRSAGRQLLLASGAPRRRRCDGRPSGGSPGEAG